MTTAILPSVGAQPFRIYPTRSLLMLYAFLAPLGNLARFSTMEAGYGATTILLLLVVAINGLPSLRILLRDRLLFSLALLTAWMAMASFVSPNFRGAIGGWVNFALYVLFACAAYRVNWTAATLYRLALFFVLGGFLSSSLTIVDFFGLLDVPRVNEGAAGYTATGLGAVLQASGPFARRSAMAAYFALVIPLAVQLFRYVRAAPRLGRLFCVATAATASIALLLTHNRAGLLGAWLAVALMSLMTARSPMKFLRLLASGAIVGMFVVWVLVTYFPAQLVVYEALLQLSDAEAVGPFITRDSDQIRVMLFKHALRSLASNPIGNGYSLVTGLPDHPNADAHNIITQIIWATGVFGIGWLFYFGGALVQRLRHLLTKDALKDPTRRYGIVLTTGLLGWLVCGMMHQILGTGMAWLLGGALIKLSKAVPAWTVESAWGRSRL